MCPWSLSRKNNFCILHLLVSYFSESGLLIRIMYSKCDKYGNHNERKKGANSFTALYCR